ncbi:DUF262 domain-containing protein [Spirosoma rhododendri]|uniref:DUF262 domain-containing protein n=1 Tax=Spirosoma rhododendri TaxID=2728024 RepID=A0A7L5DRU3_9BACT|nr:DUF262 domain-containing protein [Spirosoma rhododendri]QJD80161.1 DUF262 domain-containing protein [Spirosoma rhododendri]
MADYSLDTGKKYIMDIFASDRFYNIPDYQRAYVWGNEQIVDLLEDISNALGQDGKQGEKKEYFLGCMIWNTKYIKEANIEYACQDILDGQQRFITIYILQAVIRDISKSDDLKKDVLERMQQKGNIYKGIPERNRIEFQIRNDKDFIDKFIIKDGGTLKEMELSDLIKDKDESISTRNMAKAINFIKEWWLEKEMEIDSDALFQQHLSSFYIYLSTKVLALFLATSDNLDDAYNLFTVLNSRGVQLQSSDILRAQNLRVINDEKLRKKYASNWEEYENSVSAPYKSFDEFLWAMVYIKMKYRSDDNQSLIRAFDFMYSKQNLLEKGSSTFDFIGRYIKHLEVINSNNFQEQSGSGNCFSNINYILTTTFSNIYMVPLMHYRECFGEYGIVEFIIKIDNLYSAYWLLDNRNIQSRTFIILRRMEEIKKEQNNNKIAADQFLIDPTLQYDYVDDKASTAININNLFRIIDEEKWGAFSGTKVNKTRYLLLKLDLILSNINTHLFFSKNSASLEHLMPQKVEGTSWDIEKDSHSEWLHRIGNVVLVDRRKNASLSNSPYSTKRQKFQGAFEARANTNHVFFKYNDWNIDNIKSNHNRIVSLLKEYYSGNSLKTLKDLNKKTEAI